MADDTHKTPEDRYSEMIVDALKNREKMEAGWDSVEKLLDGDYSPLVADGENENIRMKTHLMSSRIETAVAVSMPPPDMEFIVEPANKTEGVDQHTAITAKALLDYYTNHTPDYEEFELAIQDFYSLNRGIIYVGFNPDTRDDTAHERATRVDDYERSMTINADTGDRVMGQPYIARIPRKNMLIAPGFKTIERAESSGGWIAERQIVHIDWVKGVKEFKNTNKLKGCLSNPYIDGDKAPEIQDSEPVDSTRTDKYDWVILWYIYKAPTPKNPNGKYVVFNPTNKVILYESELEKIGFQHFEVIDIMPRRSDNVIPKTGRAERPLLAYEYFETKALKGVRDAKHIVAYTDLAGEDDDFEKTLKYGDDAIIPVKVGEVNFDNNIQVIPITTDTQPAAEGSIRSKAIFDEILGPNFTDPRMGDQIATEMMFQNKIYMSKTNRNITKINRFINRVMTAKLNMTKDLCTPEEQGRMTREGSKNWEDHNEVTLDGNYLVTVKGSQLLDMTEGERSKLTQMVLQTMVSLKALPGNERRYDESPLVKEWIHDLGYSTAGIINEMPNTSQWFEIAMMMNGIPMDVEPEDNDIEHWSDMQEFGQYLKEAGLEIPDEVKQLFVDHAEKHAQQLEQQKQGASMPGMNQENIQRESMGQQIGSQGALTPGGA